MSLLAFLCSDGICRWLYTTSLERTGRWPRDSQGVAAVGIAKPYEKVLKPDSSVVRVEKPHEIPSARS